MALKRKVKGITHFAYESEAEFKKVHPHTKLIRDWRKAEEDEWCLADDGKIVQVLKKGHLKGYKTVNPYVRTVIGMFATNRNRELRGDIKNNIYRFISKTTYDSRIHGKMTKEKKVFSKYIAMGLDAQSAYMKAYPETTNLDDAKRKSTLLLRSKTVRNQVDKEIEELMSEVGITKRYLLESTKAVIDRSDVRDNDKLRALETLMKISGMLNTDKKSDSIALIQEFSGFSQEKMQAFEQGVLPKSKKELTSGN